MNYRDKTILIAEDEETNFLLLLEYLEPSGANIIRVFSGDQAVEKCQTMPIDLILMDMKMPSMNGYDAVRMIREFNKTIPIIAQTAYAMVGDSEKAFVAGCTDYLSKPISEDVFYKKIQLYL